MNIGEKILAKLQKEISQNDYECYIKKLHYDIRKSSNTLVIFMAPNILISKWVQNKYCENIAYLFELENGIRPEVKIIVGKYLNDTLLSVTRVNNVQRSKSIELNQAITREFAQNAIKDQLKEKEKHISLDDIVSVVSRELNVKPSGITSKRRTKNIVNARRIVIYIAHNLTINSMSQIALYFGMKDYTTISHAMKKIHELIDNNENFKVQLEELLNKVHTDVNVKESFLKGV